MISKTVAVSRVGKSFVYFISSMILFDWDMPGRGQGAQAQSIGAREASRARENVHIARPKLSGVPCVLYAHRARHVHVHDADDYD